MDDLQEVLQDIIDRCIQALAFRGSPKKVCDILRAELGRIKAEALHAMDIAIDEALCHPSPRDEATAPVLFEEEPRSQEV
jgi:hypothetical protein